MITKKQQRGFILAMKAGEIMMKNGGEIYRVEECIERICHACDIPHVEVFATPTGIFASIGSGGEDGDVKSYVKSIPSRTTDLQKISDVNNLSRKFVNGDIDVEGALKKVKEIETTPLYSMPLRLLGAALASSVFCVLFGGTYTDGLITIFVGMFTYYISYLLGRYKISYFIVDFCCCGIATFLALLLESLGLVAQHDFIIIGTLMLFVPGAAFTNALRDILRGDMLSGVSRLTEALAVAISLAVGAGFVLQLWNSFGGVF